MIRHIQSLEYGPIDILDVMVTVLAVKLSLG
jgi:hypothetical protein